MFSRHHSTLALIALLAALPLAAQTPLNFSVYAGSPPSAGPDDGSGASARFAFDFTTYIVVDSAGNAFLTDPATHIFICGLKGMEAGVEAAMADIARSHGADWAKLKPEMRSGGRYHVETY